MNIIPFEKENKQFIAEAAEILIECFPHAYSDCTYEEVEKCLEYDKITIVAIDNGHLVGFIGANIIGWELHPFINGGILHVRSNTK